LWLPPLADLEDASDPSENASRLVPFEPTSPPRPGGVVRHNITHRKIDVTPVFFEGARVEPLSDGWRWVDPIHPGVPTSSLFKKLVSSISDR